MKIPTQSEDEPIGWFELEEDWNDVEIKLQQCRVAKVRTASKTHVDTLKCCNLVLGMESLRGKREKNKFC